MSDHPEAVAAPAIGWADAINASSVRIAVHREGKEVVLRLVEPLLGERVYRMPVRAAKHLVELLKTATEVVEI